MIKTMIETPSSNSAETSSTTSQRKTANPYNFFRPRYWFGQVDSRPLSLFRILFAAIILKDAIYHLPLSIIQAFYTDNGIVPRVDLLSSLARPLRFSFMDSLSADWMVMLFFLVWIVVTFLMLIGYRTRLMTILSFFFILSVQERNIYILTGADTVIRVMSFWIMFLPLGDYYSVDAIRTRWKRYRQTGQLADLRVSEIPKTTYAFPLRMIQIQFALIYIFTALQKTPSPKWWDEGTAVYYALQLQTLTLPTGDWMLKNAPMWAFRVLSRLTIIAEFAFLPLIFVPILQPYAAIIAMIMMALIHLGILSMMSIADFSLVMISCYVLYFMPEWVAWLDQLLRAKRETIATSLPNAPDDPRWLLLSVTSEREISLADSESRPDVDHPIEFKKMLAHLPLSRLWLWTLRFPLIEWVVCSLVRRASASLTARTTEKEPAQPPLSVRWQLIGRITLTVFLGFILIGVLWLNVLTLNPNNKNAGAILPTALRVPIYYAGLWQQWNMFSPYPSTRDGWIVIEGKFEDGTTYDLRTGDPSSYEMKRWFFGPDERWRKFEENVANNGYEVILRTWARSYCLHYNNELNLPEGKRLNTLNIIYRYEQAFDPGTERGPLQDQVLWYHYCLQK